MKIKNLFAVAALLMGSTSAFAAHVLTEGQEQTINGIRYTVLKVYNAPTGTQVNTVKASLNGLTGTTITIPAQVTFHVKGKDDATTAADIDKDVTFNVTEVGSFAGLSTATTISVGANVESIDAGAFVGTQIASLDLSGTKVTQINRLFTAATPVAAQTNAYLTSVSLPACAEEIAASAFDGCSALTTVTFAALLDNDTDNPNDNVTTINPGAFAGTAIATLDLTNTKITELEKLFQDVNSTVTTIKLPKSLTTIKESAFAKLGKLTTIDFTACTEAQTLTIEASAFDTTPSITTLSLPAALLALEDDAFNGSSIATLTFMGNLAADAVGAINATALTSVTFKGTLAASAILANAFKSSSKLAEVTFEKKVYALGVVLGAFGDDTHFAGEDNVTATNQYGLTVNYSPKETDEVANAFAPKAFGDGQVTDGVKFVTTTHYAGVVNAMDNVFISAAAPSLTIKMANNGTGTYYYGTFYNATGDYKIATSQNGEKVMVYAAYMDQKDQDDESLQVYMDQLTIIEGCYWIPAGSAVVVKSKSNADVVAEAVTAGTHDSNHYDSSNNDLNQIETPTAAVQYAKTLKDANPGYYVYILAPFAERGFVWTQYSDNREVAAGSFYILTINPAPGRLTVVWSDGSEEDQTTAIQKIENVASEGVIYNLAGQKVDANYKGVVIKDGKKMIQK